MADKITNHCDLEVYNRAFDAAMTVFQLSVTFPKEERYSLTDQIRRASRSVCANIAEGWRRRRYAAAFVNKLNEAEAEAAETQVWLQFAVRCGYVPAEPTRDLYDTYSRILGTLVNMINHPEHWIIRPPRPE